MKEMEAVKAAAAALVAKRDQLEGVNAEIQRAQSTIEAAAQDNGEIVRLQKQRTEEIGRAFIEKREANVASIDKAIAKAQKDTADARAAAEGAVSAMQILKAQAQQLEQEIIPLQQAEDEAMNALSDKKMGEAEEMYQAAIRDIQKAFAHMAAGYGISRKVRALTDGHYVRDRAAKLKSEGIHIIQWDAAPFEKLKAELEALGVEGVGVVRRAKPMEPTKWTEPRPVTMTYEDGSVANMTLASGR